MGSKFPTAKAGVRTLAGACQLTFLFPPGTTSRLFCDALIMKSRQDAQQKSPLFQLGERGEPPFFFWKNGGKSPFFFLEKPGKSPLFQLLRMVSWVLGAITSQLPLSHNQCLLRDVSRCYITTSILAQPAPFAQRFALSHHNCHFRATSAFRI